MSTGTVTRRLFAFARSRHRRNKHSFFRIPLAASAPTKIDSCMGARMEHNSRRSRAGVGQGAGSGSYSGNVTTKLLHFRPASPTATTDFRAFKSPRGAYFFDFAHSFPNSIPNKGDRTERRPCVSPRATFAFVCLAMHKERNVQAYPQYLVPKAVPRLLSAVRRPERFLPSLQSSATLSKRIDSGFRRNVEQEGRTGNYF